MSFPVASGRWRGWTRRFRADQIVVRLSTTAGGLGGGRSPQPASRFDAIIDVIPGSWLKGSAGPFGVIGLAVGTQVLDALHNLTADPDILARLAYAEPDFVVRAAAGVSSSIWPYDRFLQAEVEFYGWQWGMRDMGMDDAWAVQQGNSSTFLAIIDTGIRSHTDLDSSRLWYGGSFLEGESMDGVFTSVYTEEMKDSVGHGLAMAGIVAATPQLTPPGDPDVSGCCGMNWGSPVGVCRSLDENGNGTVSSVYLGVLQALAWAADTDQRLVANLSLTLTETVDPEDASRTLEAMCDEAREEDALLVCATGNDTIGYPAAYVSSHPEAVLAVGYSQKETGVEEPGEGSPDSPSVIAPGRHWPVLYFFDEYRESLGSSLAAAHVTGLASLLWSQDPELTAPEVIAAIRETAYLPADASTFWGDGRIQAEAALAAVTPRAVLSLVIDESGSMGTAADPSGVTRIQVVRKAVEILLTVLDPSSHVGVVSFADAARRRMDPIEMDPDDLDASRAVVRGVLDDLAPDRTTSIGAGVVAGAAQLDGVGDADVNGSPRPAILLLTDGRENRAPWIVPGVGEEGVDLAALGVPVFSIGAGDAEAVDVTALEVLADETDGASLLAGEWSADSEHAIAKFLVQHLSDIVGETGILDPTGVLAPGDRVVVGFPVTDLEMRVDVVLMADTTRDVDFRLRAPDGTLVREGILASGVSYDEGAGARVFRINVPSVGKGGRRLGAGSWQVVLRSADSVPVPYTLLVKARSRLRLDAELMSGARRRPPFPARLVGQLVPIGIPSTDSWKMTAASFRWVDPRGDAHRIALAMDEDGHVEAALRLPGSGVYTGRLRVEGVANGQPFRRERMLTAAAWRTEQLVDEDGQAAPARPRRGRNA
jgi:subtilisin family serine protease